MKFDMLVLFILGLWGSLAILLPWGGSNLSSNLSRPTDFCIKQPDFTTGFINSDI